MAFRNRKYKDSVFTDLFGSDKDAKKNFLALYNALSGNNYKLDEVNLERKIIDQSLYKTFNNDVSWEIAVKQEEAFSDGVQQKAIEDAKNLLKEGDSPEKISRCIGLPLETVLELQKKNEEEF